MHTSIRIAGVTLAPLLLAGCGMPIGIQIASLFADGISVLTTDKTLTDHGISAVAEKDCALWRGVKGKDICQEQKDDDAVIIAAADPAPNSVSIEVTEQTPNLDQDLDIEQNWGEIAGTGKQQETVAQEETSEFPVEEPAITAAAPTLSAPSAPSMPATTSNLASWSAVTKVEELPPPPPPSPAPQIAIMVVKKAQDIATTAPASPVKRPTSRGARKTYFIIASYHRAADAERFSRRHRNLKASVIEGTAKGRRVFRVAIGPVAKTSHQLTRRRIKRGGISDSWKLTLKRTPIVTELAALN